MRDDLETRISHQNVSTVRDCSGEGGAFGTAYGSLTYLSWLAATHR